MFVLKLHPKQQVSNSQQPATTHTYTEIKKNPFYYLISPCFVTKRGETNEIISKTMPRQYQFLSINNFYFIFFFFSCLFLCLFFFFYFCYDFYLYLYFYFCLVLLLLAVFMAVCFAFKKIFIYIYVFLLCFVLCCVGCRSQNRRSSKKNDLIIEKHE